MTGKIPLPPTAGCHDFCLKIMREYSHVQEPRDVPGKQVSGNVLLDIRKECGLLNPRGTDPFFCSEGNVTDLQSQDGLQNSGLFGNRKTS